jgi:protein-L-isoaspartate O-methyltransferase
MSNPALEIQVEAAKAYEALFVPALFSQWAPRVVDAAGVSAGQRVLDVACGTGVLAREAHLRTGPTGDIVGLDRSAGMLAVAKELAPSIDWRQGAAESMPFPDASFDVVLSQFGLMFMDREQAIREMLRVLKPAGRLAVAVWDDVENIPAFRAEIELIERLAGPRAANAVRAPFGLGNREHLALLFNGAGAGPVTITTLQGVAHFPSARVLVEADLRGWLPVVGVNLSEELIASVLAEAERVLAPYAKPDGQVAFEVQAHVVTATKP